MQKAIKEQLETYRRYLEEEEKSKATKEQYLRDIRDFLIYKGEQEWSKELVIRYKEQLCSQYQPTSANAKIAALNSFFSFIGKETLKVKYLKIQQKAYCSKEKELSKAEYLRLLETAQRKMNKNFCRKFKNRIYFIDNICYAKQTLFWHRKGDLLFVLHFRSKYPMNLQTDKMKRRSLPMESRLKKYFPMIRTRKEVMQCIFEQKTLREQFENWGEEAQEEY